MQQQKYTMQKTIQHIRAELAPYYPQTEISGFIQLIMDSVLGLSYTQLILEKERVLKSKECECINSIVNRLKKYEPIQYILGTTLFYGLMLDVAPGVLIPRPETEELVSWISKTKLPERAKIIDIGTGSGCIALALKNELTDAELLGVDVSGEALALAANNAQKNNLEVTFKKADILQWNNIIWPQFDVVVSNPPYVLDSEKKQMQANVLEYEPQLALFVNDNDPLVFYRNIAQFAQQQLKKGGLLFFEINENMGDEMEKLVKQLEFSNVELRCDINGKTRMLKCEK